MPTGPRSGKRPADAAGCAVKAKSGRVGVARAEACRPVDGSPR